MKKYKIMALLTALLLMLTACNTGDVKETAQVCAHLAEQAVTQKAKLVADLLVKNRFQHLHAACVAGKINAGFIAQCRALAAQVGVQRGAGLESRRIDGYRPYRPNRTVISLYQRQ